jgi:NADPH:quinone reductase-like Zn-dependent oxidoreductase
VGGLLSSLFTSRRFRTFVMTPNRDDLLFLKELVEAGKATPVIERSYALSEVADALRHVGEGHAQGLTVIRISRSLAPV